jgi:hypothetical protein
MNQTERNEFNVSTRFTVDGRRLFEMRGDVKVHGLIRPCRSDHDP